jgi:adenylosuccinate synthase
MKGWNKNLTELHEEQDFPVELKDYIAFIEKELEIPITLVSVGPDRKQTIIIKK